MNSFFSKSKKFISVEGPQLLKDGVELIRKKYSNNSKNFLDFSDKSTNSFNPVDIKKVSLIGHTYDTDWRKSANDLLGVKTPYGHASIQFEENEKKRTFHATGPGEKETFDKNAYNQEATTRIEMSQKHVDSFKKNIEKFRFPDQFTKQLGMFDKFEKFAPTEDYPGGFMDMEMDLALGKKNAGRIPFAPIGKDYSVLKGMGSVLQKAAEDPSRSKLMSGFLDITGTALKAITRGNTCGDTVNQYLDLGNSLQRYTKSTLPEDGVHKSLEELNRRNKSN